MILGGVFVLILGTIFFWNEKLSIKYRINDQKITNLFLIVTGTVTSFSVLLLAKQLEEQRINRLASVLPDIYPEDFQCELIEGEHKIGGKDGIHIVPKDYNSYWISIDNIGIGPAKEIHTEWIYSIDQVNDLIKGTYEYFTPMKRGDSDYINFLKPEQTGKVYLPFFYILCCGPNLNLRSASSGSDGVFGIKPSLKLRTNYMDINNRAFEKIFNVDVQAFEGNLFFKVR